MLVLLVLRLSAGWQRVGPLEIVFVYLPMVARKIDTVPPLYICRFVYKPALVQ